jgi:hypothetical protein
MQYERFIGGSKLMHCEECGQVERCCPSVLERKMLCYGCFVKKVDEERYARLVRPFPVAELKHGGLMPLDVEDFASTY